MGRCGRYRWTEPVKQPSQARAEDAKRYQPAAWIGASLATSIEPSEAQPGCAAKLLLTLRPSTNTSTKPQPTRAVARLISTELPK